MNVKEDSFNVIYLTNHISGLHVLWIKQGAKIIQPKAKNIKTNHKKKKKQNSMRNKPRS